MTVRSAESHELDFVSGDSAATLLSLIFAAGSRPDLDGLKALGDGEGATGFAISLSATDGDMAWAEILASGLTFDCLGLAPGSAAAFPEAAKLVGIEHSPAGEAIALRPGPHIAGAAALAPVFRVLLGIASRIAELPDVRAVCWEPAGSLIDPAWFRRIVSDWLGGGPFPAVGLTVLERDAAGKLVSRGLAFFTGQELSLQPDRRWNAEIQAKLALRLIDYTVANGALIEPRELAFDNMPLVVAAPIEGARTLRVSLGANGR